MQILIPRFETSDNNFEVSRSQSLYNQNITLNSNFLHILSGFQREVELCVRKRDGLNDLWSLVQNPLKPQSLQTSEGIFVCVVGEQLQFLNLLYIHHAGFSHNYDPVNFPDSDGDVEDRLCADFSGSDKDGRIEGTHFGYLNYCLMRTTARNAVVSSHWQNFGGGGCPMIATALSSDELERKYGRGKLELRQQNVQIVNFSAADECQQREQED